MLGNGEAKKEAIRPDFNKSIFIDFAGAQIADEFFLGLIVTSITSSPWKYEKQAST